MRPVPELRCLASQEPTPPHPRRGRGALRRYGVFVLLVACMGAAGCGDPAHPRRLVGDWDQVLGGRRSGRFLSLSADGTATLLGFDRTWSVRRNPGTDREFLCLTGAGDDGCRALRVSRDTLSWGFADFVRAR